MSGGLPGEGVPVDNTEQAAILTIALMAAFADGAKDDRERAQIRQIADALSANGGVDVAGLYQSVLFKRPVVEDVVRAIATPEARQFAYEMAVCVCDADGAQNEAEQRFLESLRRALGLDAAAARVFGEKAAAVAEAPLAEPGAMPPVGKSAERPVVAALAADTAALDKSILNYAILNGALELLPQSLASMAIIPLQMKMVYRIGKAFGFELDRGHIKDLLATLGVGLTSQYIEDIGRKLIGGLLRRVGGRLLGGLGRQATSSAMSFATTYALGQVAKRYYGSGRTLDTAMLRETFQSMLADARQLSGRYAGEIEQKARTIDVDQLLTVVRQQ